MLWQVCQHECLSGLLDKMFEDTNNLNFLEDQPPSLTQKAQQSQNTTHFSEIVYEAILIWIQQEYPLVWYYHEFPHLLNRYVLAPWANNVQYVIYKTHTFTTYSTYPANSSISFYSSLKVVEYGYISHIWTLTPNTSFTQPQTFFLISLYKKISGDDVVKSPYCSYPGFKCLLVHTPGVQRALPDTMVVKLEQVIFHIAFFDHPSGTFGIKGCTTVLVYSLHRSRQ